MKRMAVATVLVGVALLTGCAGSASGVHASLQGDVVEIAEHAAAGDADAALAALDALEQRVDDALLAGDIDAKRALAIRDAIAAVRADLEQAATPAPTPSETTPATEAPVVDDDTGDEGAVEGDDGDDGGNQGEGGGSGNGNQGNGNGNQGSGNGNQGNGNGGNGGGQGNGKK